jgi:far upstream element-binding protein
MGPSIGADGTVTEMLPVPNPLVGFVIGKGGEHIRDVQQRTGTHVQVQRENEMTPGAFDRIVTISGPAASVAIAKQMIQQMVDSRRDGPRGVAATGANAVGISSGEGSGGSTIHVPIPDAKVGLVIGKAGATVQTIQRKTGVHIQVGLSFGGTVALAYSLLCLWCADTERS